MRIHKQLKWLGPYLEGVAHLVPLKKLSLITLRFYEQDQRPGHLGLCTLWTDKTYTITVKLPDDAKGSIPLPWHYQEEVLCHLSHELSHMVYMDHSVERFLLETVIYHQFAVTLSRLNYEIERNKVK